MGRDKKPKAVKPNKYGDTNTQLRIRTSDLLVLKEALLYYRRYLKHEMKNHEHGERMFHVIDDLHGTSSYLLERVDLRYQHDYKQLDPADKEFYTRLKSIYKGVR